MCSIPIWNSMDWHGFKPFGHHCVTTKFCCKQTRIIHFPLSWDASIHLFHLFYLLSSMLLMLPLLCYLGNAYKKYCIDFCFHLNDVWTVFCGFLNCDALDEMGSRIDELEHSINDLRAEMGTEGASSPLPPSNAKSDETKPAEGSAWDPQRNVSKLR